jgi:anti-sigma B factor antagonist
MLSLESEADGSVAIVGRLDAAQAPAAQAFLDRLSGPVLLDCTRLDYISSAGLGVLLKTQKRLMAHAGRLRLRGVSRHVRDILVYSGFDQIIEIEAAP